SRIRCRGTGRARGRRARPRSNRSCGDAPYRAGRLPFPAMAISYYTCPLCEATCGLELHVEDRAVTLVRGDKDDGVGHGYLCPKGAALRALESDPDRLRAPQIRVGDEWRDASWDAAFELIDENLTRIVAEHGPDALAVYLGNPTAHNLSGLLYGRVLLQAART